MGETNYRNIIKTYHVDVLRMARKAAETEQAWKHIFPVFCQKQCRWEFYT